MIFYTVSSLMIDKDKSADPVDYVGRHHERLGRELNACLIRHDKSKGTSKKLGSTTKHGPHSFFLTSKPDIDDLVYWNVVKTNQYPMVMGCNGYLQVYDHNGNAFNRKDQKKYSMAQEKAFTQEQKENLMYSRAEKLIKKYFKT